MTNVIGSEAETRIFESAQKFECYPFSSKISKQTTQWHPRARLNLPWDGTRSNHLNTLALQGWGKPISWHHIHFARKMRTFVGAQ